MGSIATAIIPAANLTMNYAEGMLKDVRAESFARKPNLGGKIIDTNHPAWVYGHLSIYANKVCQLTGIDPGPTVNPAGWEELFKNGTPSTDDPTGKIFPSMEAITRHYFAAYRHVIAKLPEIDDATLAKPNPMGGRMTELMPTIGAAVNFLMSGHQMSHFGQISTWRRCVGLGSAF